MNKNHHNKHDKKINAMPVNKKEVKVGVEKVIEDLSKTSKPLNKEEESKKELVPIYDALADEAKTTLLHEKDYKFNAPHLFVVKAEDGKELANIHFQEGPIKEYGVNGVSNEDLLLMVHKRLSSFQDSQFACEENRLALEKLTECLMWLKRRTDKRKFRGVEGTNII